MKTDDKNIDLNKMPAITMNTTDKLFFALARRDTETLSYVYALVINNLNAERGGTPEYPMDIKTEISAFKNVENANMYFETATLVMQSQKTGILKKLYDTFGDVFKKNITDFNQMVAGFKTRTK